MWNKTRPTSRDVPLREVLESADTTGPPTPYGDLVRAASDVRDANNRYVRAQVEIERARQEYHNARVALAQMILDYGITVNVDGVEIKGVADE